MNIFVSLFLPAFVVMLTITLGCLVNLYIRSPKQFVKRKRK